MGASQAKPEHTSSSTHKVQHKEEETENVFGPDQLENFDKIYDKIISSSDSKSVTRHAIKEYSGLPDYLNNFESLFLNKVFEDKNELTKHELLSRLEKLALPGKKSSKNHVNVLTYLIADDVEKLTKEKLQPLFKMFVHLAHFLYDKDETTLKHWEAIIDQLFNGAFEDEQVITVSDLTRYILKSCPGLLKSTLNKFIINNFVTCESETSDGEDPEEDEENEADKIPVRSSANYIWEFPELLPKDSFPKYKLWQLGIMLSVPKALLLKKIYSSCHDGSSMNRFSHHVFDYKGPTVIFIECEDGTIFGSYVSTEWKDSPNFQGDNKCYLYCLNPTFSVYNPKAGVSNLVYANTRKLVGAHKIPIGIGFGGTSAYTNFRIWINDDLQSGSIHPSSLVYEFGELTRERDFKIRELFVFGCGGADAEKAQAYARARESKEIERRRKVDRRMMAGETWSESADKWMLDLVGKTGSSNAFMGDLAKKETELNS